MFRVKAVVTESENQFRPVFIDTGDNPVLYKKLIAVLMLRRLFARFLNMCMVIVILSMRASWSVMVGMSMMLR